MIVLTQGKMALVDKEDQAWLGQWKWHISGKKVLRCELKSEHGDNKRGNRIMSREIMAHHGIDTEGFMVDHINHNTFDNRLVNLRLATNSQNMANRKLSISGHKGVYWQKQIRRWVSRIGHNGKYIFLGCFKNIIDAKKTYNRAAKKLFGEYALLNKEEV